MSVEAISWALKQDTGNTGRKCLLVVIANHANKDGVCWPGRSTLASECECRPATVSANIAELEERGLLARCERRRGNGSRTTDWIILAPRTDERGDMLDADPEEYPEEVSTLARSGSVIEPEEGGSGSVFVEGQVRFSGGPEPSVEPSEPSSLRSEDSLPTDSEIAPVSPDVEDLCRVLAGEVKGNGYSVRDPLSPAWTNPMRLLLERDRDPLSGEQWTPAQVRHAILWATSDEFWRLNIRSAANLRKHFEQLVARIRAGTNGHSRDPDERAAVERLVAMREQMNAIREARG